jgi:lauroyl/myristoyl acyltransferase
MTLQEFITTEFGTKLWMSLGRWLPPWAGHGLARIATGIITRRRHASIYRILADNQAGVRGLQTPPEMLHRSVRDVLCHVGQTAYDLMHAVAQGEEAIRAAVTFADDFWTNLRAAQAIGRGVMVCGAHTSNFNLMFLALGSYDIPTVQVLSPPSQTGGFRVMRDLRSASKVLETPIDSASLRQAIARLRSGGFVATGVDWPLAAAADDILPFFGRPAHLPTGHIRLALTANATMLPVACRWSAARGYYAMTGPPLPLEISGNRAVDVQHNARRVLAVIEQWIAETPDQWLMYHPVWPGWIDQETENRRTHAENRCERGERAPAA